jgi:electron transfer flavoprotein beta subunit
MGVVLAERLGMPHSTIIMEVQVQEAAAGGGLRIKRELEGGWFQWIVMPLPALLTIQSGINQLRYATLKGIMAAKKKPLDVRPAQLGEVRLTVESMALPPERTGGRIVGEGADAVPELVRLLRTEAKVL